MKVFVLKMLMVVFLFEKDKIKQRWYNYCEALLSEDPHFIRLSYLVSESFEEEPEALKEDVP